MATVVNQWAGTTAQPAVFSPLPAPNASTVIPLDASASVGGGSGVPAAGNWLFCIAGWNQSGGNVSVSGTGPSGPPVTVSVGDDTHQWWRPAAPSGAGGITRTTVWYQPNIMPPATVFVAPDGCAAGTAVLVIEVSGLGPWDVVTGTGSNFVNFAAALDLTLTMAAPGTSSFIIAAVTGNCGGTGGAGLTFTPAGWSPLQQVTASDGTDHASDTVLIPACITSSSAQSVTATESQAWAISGFIIAVEVTAPSPVPAGLNPNWPYVLFEAAWGSGYQTPPDQMTWVNLQSPANGRRLRAWKETTGPQYELDALESSEAEPFIDNPDGHVSPWNPASPWYPQVVPGTPVRMRMVPPATTGASRWYIWQRNMERWPQGWESFRGQSNAVATDAWSVINKTLPTCYRAQVLANGPYAWWPCDDSGVNNATSLVNAAPGNSSPLVITPAAGGSSAVLSNYPFTGAVTTYAAVPAFAQATGWMYGDPDSAAFQVSGCGSTSHGYYLACTDPDFPPLTGNGITIDGAWNVPFYDADGQGAQVQGLFQQPGANLILWQLQDSAGNPVASLYLAQGSGNLTLATWAAGGTGEVITTLSTGDSRDTSWILATVTLNATTFYQYVTVNGVLAASLFGSFLAPSFESFYALGAPDGSVTAGCCSASASHLAVYPYALSPQQVIASHMAAYTAFGQLPPPVVSAQFVSNPGSGGPTVYCPDGVLRGGQAFTAPTGGGASSLGAVACTTCNGYDSAPSSPATKLVVLPTDTPPGFCWVDTGGGTAGSGSFAAPGFAWFTGSAHGAELQDAVAVPTHPYVYVNSYGSGSAPPAQASALGDTVAARIERLLLAGQAAGARCIDPAAEPVLAELDAGGQQCGTAISNVTASDNGLLFVDNLNYLCYWQRSRLASQPAMWVLGPNAAAGQIPFTAGTDSLDTDPQQVRNDIEVTQYDITQAAASAQSGLSTGSGETAGGLVFSPSASLYPQVQASLMQNGDCQYPLTSYLQDTASIQAQCDWLFDEYGTPVQRITGLTVSAAAMTRTAPQAWLFLLGANVGDLIQAVFTYPGQPPVTGTWRITRLSNRQLDFRNGAASVEVAADYAPRTWWNVTTLAVIEDEAGATITDEQGGWLI